MRRRLAKWGRVVRKRGDSHPLLVLSAVDYNGSMVTESQEKTADETISLKDPALAGFLAWLVPGLGHLYQGRRAKAALFFVCIMGLFVYGLYLGGSDSLGYGRAVYCAWRPGDKRFYYFAQIGVGAAALPSLMQANRMSHQHPVWFGGLMAPPRPDGARGDDPNASQPSAGDLHKQLHHYFELATFFTMIAGLLNVLAIYDACAGPVVMTASDSEKEKEATEQTA